MAPCWTNSPNTDNFIAQQKYHENHEICFSFPYRKSLECIEPAIFHTAKTTNTCLFIELILFFLCDFQTAAKATERPTRPQVEFQLRVRGWKSQTKTCQALGPIMN